jgi:glycosyltransferase involved in cell wall biosynthesis
MNNEPEISIIIPVFNEEKNIEPLFNKIKYSLDEIGRQYEILFINDGSTDKTEGEIKKLAASNKIVKCISFRSNFQKAAAYSAGFEYSNGKIVITMDGDLQDDPSEIKKFLDKIDEGYDYVSGWKYKGKGNPYRALPSKFFNFIVKRINKLELHDFNCPFKAFKRGVIEPSEVYGELYRFLPVIARGKGFKIAEIKIENLPRIHGKSKYGIERFLRGFFDSLTMMFLSKYYQRPLHFFGVIGLVLLLFGSISIMSLYLLKFIFGILIQNTPFLFGLSLVSIVLGVQFISLGLISELAININHKNKTNYYIKERF